MEKLLNYLETLPLTLAEKEQFKKIARDVLGLPKPSEPWNEYLYRLPLSDDQKEALYNLVTEEIEDAESRGYDTGFEEAKDGDDRFGV